MNERAYMTKKGFRSLKERDWDNGAVRDKLYESVCRMERMEARIKAAKEFIADIASQKTTDELTVDDMYEDADFEGAYEQMILLARELDVG